MSGNVMHWLMTIDVVLWIAVGVASAQLTFIRKRINVSATIVERWECVRAVSCGMAVVGFVIPLFFNALAR